MSKNAQMFLIGVGVTLAGQMIYKNMMAAKSK